MLPWCCHGAMVLAWSHGTVMVPWCCHGFMVPWCCHGPVVLSWSHGAVMVPWCCHGPMVLSWSHSTSKQNTTQGRCWWSMQMLTKTLAYNHVCHDATTQAFEGFPTSTLSFAISGGNQHESIVRHSELPHLFLTTAPCQNTSHPNCRHHAPFQVHTHSVHISQSTHIPGPQPLAASSLPLHPASASALPVGGQCRCLLKH